MKHMLATTACLLLGVTLAHGAEPAPPWLRLGPHTVYDAVTSALIPESAVRMAVVFEEA